jgi:hypothetical protein
VTDRNEREVPRQARDDKRDGTSAEFGAIAPFVIRYFGDITSWVFPRRMVRSDVVTLRRYFNVAEAAFAKTLLDDQGIFCSMADENSYLYGGAGFAMSARILVAEEQFQEALRILDEPAPALLQDLESSAVAVPSMDDRSEPLPLDEPETRMRPEPPKENNPWELLAIALLFAGPGVFLLFQKHFALMTRGRYVTILSPTDEHRLGAIAVAIGLGLIGLYFHTRRAIREERTAFLDAMSQNRDLHRTAN